MEQNGFNFAGLDIRVVCTQVTGICYLMRKSACLQTKESVFFSAVRCAFSTGSEHEGICWGSFVVFWCSNSKMTQQQ
jgi:hypothetical protein